MLNNLLLCNQMLIQPNIFFPTQTISFYEYIIRYFVKNKDIMIVATSLFTGFLLLFTLVLNIKKAKRDRKAQGINALFKLQNEYVKLKFHLQEFYGYIRGCENKKEKVIPLYNQIVEAQIERIRMGNLQYENTLEYYRQTISHFYQKLAMYYVQGLIVDNIIFPTWSHRDLIMLGDVIIPLEKSIKGYDVIAINNLTKLYNNFCKYLKKRNLVCSLLQ
jgi:hypothetical protein